MTLYFAYGSNLCPDQMKCRCGNVVFRTRAKLEDYRLHFPKWSDKWGGYVASIVKFPGCEVWGVVYELTKDQISELDGFEKSYERINKIEVIPDCPNEEKLKDVETYIAKSNKLNKNNKPSQEYIDKIISGAEFWGLPKKYIKKLKNNKVNNI